jgi:hypothetical protein
MTAMHLRRIEDRATTLILHGPRFGLRERNAGDRGRRQASASALDSTAGLQKDRADERPKSILDFSYFLVGRSSQQIDRYDNDWQIQRRRS